MRKTLFLSLTLGGLIFGAFGFHSCQKETRETATSKKKELDASNHSQKCLRPEHITSRQVDVHCVQGYACDAFPSIPPLNRNRIRWKTTGCTNAPYTGMSAYAIYKKTTPGTIPIYTRIATFQCNKSDMWYANPALTNSSEFVLLVDHPDIASFPATMEEHSYPGGFYDYYSGGVAVNHNDSWKFSTGSTAGTVSCVVVGPGKDG
ncbi:hypothetical protein D3C87_197250 [compost metagenome]